MATFDASRYLKDFESAWNAKDPSIMTRHAAESVEFQDPRSDKLVRGKQALASSFVGWFGAFSEMRITPKEMIVSGTNVALLYTCAGRHTGELEISPGERVPATNKPVTVDVAEFIRIDADGLIARDIATMDSAKLLMQLGLLPGSAATRSEPRAKVQP